jgi:hypothetical protein
MYCIEWHWVAVASWITSRGYPIGDGIACPTETTQRFSSVVMLNLARFRDLARRAMTEEDPAQLREILAEMEIMLRAEQRALKRVLAERRLRYPGPPIEPGLQ